MSHHIAARLLALFGPCRIAVAGAADPALSFELRLHGCDVRTGDAIPGTADVVLAVLDESTNAAEALGGLCRRHGAARHLALMARERNRPEIESVLFGAGWRRHPGDMTVAGFGILDDARMGEMACYERIPADALRRWSASDPATDRPLRTDMLRQGGSRADAHIARYALAADMVRPGDTVVDCACGRGYGTAVMAGLSRGNRFIGVDADEDAVEYARANYGVIKGVEFHRADAARLDDMPDASVDLVVSMESLEHAEDWRAVLRTFRRILRPDGRLIASVPDRWTDETGKAPNPDHPHVFDWRSFADELANHFIVERRFAQSAPGGVKLHRARRMIAEVPLEAGTNAEWLIAVASVNPMEEGLDRARDFTHPAFNTAMKASGAVVVDFASGYDNPYLYRPLVQMGERLGNDDKLARLAELAMTLSRPGSADQGAAICVLGYRALELRNENVVPTIIELIEHYSDTSREGLDNPHVVRWRLSLTFLAGRLAELAGDRQKAIHWFRLASYGDWGDFSPLIATKVVAAAVHEGALHLADGDDETARECFARGLDRALAALRGNVNEVVGNECHPIPFGLQEMAEIADMGSQCANAVAWFSLAERDRGLFWRQVDIKRFGLASWARDVERANRNLREHIRTLERRAAANRSAPIAAQ